MKGEKQAERVAQLAGEMTEQGIEAMLDSLQLEARRARTLIEQSRQQLDQLTDIVHRLERTLAELAKSQLRRRELDAMRERPRPH